jgi:MFS transporter, DHA1 family, multidrug resistance protein
MILNIHSRAFTVFLGALTALPPLAIDTALPGLSLLQADFGASQTEAAATIGIFLIGFATAPVAVGPFADRFGRKPVMLAGILIYMLSAAGSALAPSIGALIAFRLVQGVGAGTVGILPRAIIRDLFEGHESRVHLAAVSMIFSVAPLIAPTLGAGILAVGSWRLIYAVMTVVAAALGVVAFLFFGESHPAEARRNLMPATVIAGYRRALTNRMCAGFALVGGLAFAGLFAYVNVSPLLFIEGYGVSKSGFALLFACTASGVIAGSLINNWLVNRHTRPRTVLDAGLVLVALSGLTLIAVGLVEPRSPLFVVAPVMVYIMAYGLIFPNAAHEAVHPLPEIAGIASGVLVTAQMLFGAAGGTLAAALYQHKSPLAIGIVMSAGSLIAAAIYIIWLRGHVKS